MTLTGNDIKETTLKATLTFPDRETAKGFSIEWGRKSLMGNTMSAVKQDGSVDVSIYNITKELKRWVDTYIASINKQLNTN